MSGTNMSAPDYTPLLAALTSLAREVKALDSGRRYVSLGARGGPVFDALLALGGAGRTNVYQDGHALDVVALTIAGVEFETQSPGRPATAEEMAALGERVNRSLPLARAAERPADRRSA